MEKSKMSSLEYFLLVIIVLVCVAVTLHYVGRFTDSINQYPTPNCIVIDRGSESEYAACFDDESREWVSVESGP